jgi:hypothetical protein
MIDNVLSKQLNSIASNLTTGIVCLLLSGCTNGSHSSTDNAQTKGIVVIAKKDIQEGALIKIEAVEEKEILTDKIPQDAITSASLTENRIAKYGIQTGQIVSQHDLAPPRTHFIYLDLPQNQIQKLRQLAHKKETTISELAAEIIEKRLSQLDKTCPFHRDRG